MAQATVQLNGTVNTFQLTAKTFKTGNKGYHGFGKMEGQGGERYQVNILVVKIEVKK